MQQHRSPIPWILSTENGEARELSQRNPPALRAGGLLSYRGGRPGAVVGAGRLGVPWPVLQSEFTTWLWRPKTEGGTQDQPRAEVLTA